jgi:hypothetical protein
MQNKITLPCMISEETREFEAQIEISEDVLKNLLEENRELLNELRSSDEISGYDEISGGMKFYVKTWEVMNCICPGLFAIMHRTILDKTPFSLERMILSLYALSIILAASLIYNKSSEAIPSLFHKKPEDLSGYESALAYGLTPIVAGLIFILVMNYMFVQPVRAYRRANLDQVVPFTIINRIKELTKNHVIVNQLRDNFTSKLNITIANLKLDAKKDEENELIITWIAAHTLWGGGRLRESLPQFHNYAWKILMILLKGATKKISNFKLYQTHQFITRKTIEALLKAIIYEKNPSASDCVPKLFKLNSNAQSFFDSESYDEEFFSTTNEAITQPSTPFALFALIYGLMCFKKKITQPQSPEKDLKDLNLVLEHIEDNQNIKFEYLQLNNGEHLRSTNESLLENIFIVLDIFPGVSGRDSDKLKIKRFVEELLFNAVYSYYVLSDKKSRCCLNRCRYDSVPCFFYAKSSQEILEGAGDRLRELAPNMSMRQ